MIVSDIGGFSDDAHKYGGGQGRKDWLENVHAVKLSTPTPKAIQEWKRSFIAKAGSDPVSQRSAKVSVNSFLRFARSLFSPKVLAHLALELPNPLPFAGCQFEPGQNMKYRSTFDVQVLVGSACDELAIGDPEAFKVFLLGAMVGLRRREIDLLEWNSFRWDEGTIRIEATQHFSAKSEDSYADVAIDSELVQLFRCARYRPFRHRIRRRPQTGMHLRSLSVRRDFQPAYRLASCARRKSAQTVARTSQGIRFDSRCESWNSRCVPSAAAFSGRDN
jgi:hypothetical protein